MLVPFAQKLDNMVRSIKQLLIERGKENVPQQVREIHLYRLILLIDDGLFFRDTYSGTREILETSEIIHDLFRLAHGNVFPSLSSELPLE